MPDWASSYSYDKDQALGQSNPRCDVAKSACREHFESSSAHPFSVPFPRNRHSGIAKSLQESLSNRKAITAQLEYAQIVDCCLVLLAVLPPRSNDVFFLDGCRHLLHFARSTITAFELVTPSFFQLKH
jgi:hypothetical protein